jgi:Uma2 family endonuclease
LALVRLFVERHNLGVALGAPFIMREGIGLSAREPDVLFIAREHRGQIRKNYLDGPADLAVEIISPDSRKRDRKEKFEEYERAGVAEYWVIDPIRRQADFFQLGEDRVYHLITIGEDGVFRSAILPGFWLKVDWFWREPLPPLWSVLKEWGWV